MPTKAAVAAVRRSCSAASRTAAAACLTDTCDCPFVRDYSAPFPAQVPLTSIYSKGDGVVRWRACRVSYARNVEVTGSHVGLAFNRRAYRVLGLLLAGRGDEVRAATDRPCRQRPAAATLRYRPARRNCPATTPAAVRGPRSAPSGTAARRLSSSAGRAVPVSGRPGATGPRRASQSSSNGAARSGCSHR